MAHQTVQMQVFRQRGVNLMAILRASLNGMQPMTGQHAACRAEAQQRVLDHLLPRLGIQEVTDFTQDDQIKRALRPIFGNVCLLDTDMGQVTQSPTRERYCLFDDVLAQQRFTALGQ